MSPICSKCCIQDKILTQPSLGTEIRDPLGEEGSLEARSHMHAFFEIASRVAALSVSQRKRLLDRKVTYKHAE